nr:MAG TPA: hypothetical protein [Caudoviricetes sp.]
MTTCCRRQNRWACAWKSGSWGEDCADCIATR